MAHFVEQAVCEVPLAGAEDVTEDDVVGEDGGSVESHVVDPVEDGEGAAPVGLAGEEGDHEADGEAAGFVRGEEGVEVVVVLGGADGGGEVVHVDGMV